MASGIWKEDGDFGDCGAAILQDMVGIYRQGFAEVLASSCEKYEEIRMSSVPMSWESLIANARTPGEYTSSF